ncbi:hypothetical protein E4U21_001700 [Claviceps maximensis]|nr:hypothetical protein E4U21_001700 [Claviceps maximensis]
MEQHDAAKSPLRHSHMLLLPVTAPRDHAANLAAPVSIHTLNGTAPTFWKHVLLVPLFVSTSNSVLDATNSTGHNDLTVLSTEPCVPNGDPSQRYRDARKTNLCHLAVVVEDSRA